MIGPLLFHSRDKVQGYIWAQRSSSCKHFYFCDGEDGVRVRESDGSVKKADLVHAREHAVHEYQREEFLVFCVLAKSNAKPGSRLELNCLQIISLFDQCLIIILKAA